MTCGRCRYSYVEDWGKGKDAVRCRAKGPHQFHVVKIVPHGRDLEAYILRADLPTWCYWRENE